MAKFSFEVCQLDQVDELTNYIDEYWVKGHVLTTSRELLDWQHKSLCGNHYNFVMARDNNSGNICGVLGFIPTSRYSSDLAGEKEAWLAIWKVNEGPKYIGLGFGLLNFLKREFDIQKICSVGISKIVYPMYQTLGFKVGKLSQYVLINRSLPEFKVAVVPEQYCCDYSHKHSAEHSVSLIDFNDIERKLSNFQLFSQFTKKNAEYFVNRFVKHPKYQYQFLGLYHKDKLVAFMVARCVESQGSKVLRGVDFQGDYSILPRVSGYLYDYLVREKLEYMDIMQYGIDDNIFIDSGFCKVSDQGDSLIIPDYFEPFVQKNINICFARQASGEKSFVLFKGDADQDRPNRM